MHILRHFPTLANTSNSAHEWHLVPWCLITLRSAPDAIPPPRSLYLSPLSFPARQALLLLLLFSVCAIHWCCWSCDWSPWRNLVKYIPAVYSNWNTYWVSSVLHHAIIRRLNNWKHFKPTSFSRFTYKQRQVYDINVPGVCSSKKYCRERQRIHVINKSFQNAAKFKYLGIVTDQNCVPGKMNSGLKSSTSC